MKCKFKKKIWSNNEQKIVGVVDLEIKIDECDFNRFKKLYKYFYECKNPQCNNCGKCVDCNYGEPEKIYPHARNKDKKYFNDKYIKNNLHLLQNMDISVIFQKGTIWYRDKF